MIDIIKVLIIEDDITFATLLKEQLSMSAIDKFEVAMVDKVYDAIEKIPTGNFDVILLDLNLPDSRGIDTVKHIREATYDLPIIVLTGEDDASMALKSVRMGMQDYLIKGQLDTNSIIRSIRYAIERHKMQMMLKNLAVVDELTGIANRRGFLTLAKKQIKIAERSQKEMLLFMFDLDGLKDINDNLGHHEGDLAIIDTSNVIKETFRESDIIARLAGDEFIALAIDANLNDANILLDRIKKAEIKSNSDNKRKFKLSISIGYSHFNPSKPSDLDTLLLQADKMMYEEKNKKKKNITG